MCLLFLFTNPNPVYDEYSLIIASIRDEFYDRPSRHCHFWERYPQIVGGMDYTEGKEGGTWLAMNTSGKVAALLNVMKPSDYLQHKKSRGFLSVDYLMSDFDGLTYLNRIAKNCMDFDGFLLITIDIEQPRNQVKASYLTNMDEINEPHLIRPGVSAFGNSPPSQPWKKAYFGKRVFAEILSKNNKRTDRENLVNSLFSMMSDEKEYFPDNQLMADSDGLSLNEADIRKLSSFCVRLPNILFGSRTQSIILIDAEGNVDYMERTMQEPIDQRNHNNWIDTRLAFRLQFNNTASISRL